MSESNRSSFDVDGQGMFAQYRDKGPVAVLVELLSNSLDTDAKVIEVAFERVSGNRYALAVTDDHPHGFENLADAYTVFAPSSRRFDGEMVCTPEEAKLAIDTLGRVILPPDVLVRVNGVPLPKRAILTSFVASLPTIKLAGDEDGTMVPGVEATTVNVYRPVEGQRPTIYELGVPVVAREGDVYDCDVQQKVPLNRDRDNVTEAFHRRLSVAVVNHTASLMNQREAQMPQVRKGIVGAEREAVRKVAETKYGKPIDEIVIGVPNGGETNVVAVSHGDVLIPPQKNSTEENTALRDAGVKTSREKYGRKSYAESEMIPDRDLTPVMRLFRDLCVLAVRKVLNKSVSVSFVTAREANTIADCARWSDDRCAIRWNVGHPAIGREWFRDHPLTTEDQINTLIHEMAHHDGADHYTRDFYDQCTKIGARLLRLAHTDPDFDRFW